MTRPCFRLEIGPERRVLEVSTLVEPDLVIGGDGWQAGIVLLPEDITGREEADEFLREVLAYQVNEGAGMYVDDSGIIEAEAEAFGGYPQVVWQFFGGQDHDAT